MALTVVCQPGFDGLPEPVEVWFGSRRVVARAISDRWFGDGQRWVRLEGDDDQTYVLRWSELAGTWDLAGLRRRDDA